MSNSAGEIIQIHVGQAGVQIANACWELYCIEHGISTDGCVTKIPEDNSYTTFFSLTKTMKVEPRLIMVDAEPNVLDEIRKGSYRFLFHPDTLISGKEDSGNNFARGYYTMGQEMIDCTMDNIRKMAEKCNNIRGFLTFRAIGGGTGSGIGNLIMENINDYFQKLPKLEFLIFPSPSVSPVIVEPYNALLSTHKGMEVCDCSFVIDNESLYDICAQKLDVNSPTYTNLNRIIAQVVSTFTASQRFLGDSNINFGEFQTNLVPYPRIRFPLVSYAPLVTPAKSTYGGLSLDQVTNQCFDASNQLVRCDIGKGKYVACVLLYRGDVRSSDVSASIANLKKQNVTRFVDWSPSGFRVAINSRPSSFVPAGDLAATNRSLLALANNSAIRKTWCKLTIKYNQLLSRRAFIHHYIQEGIEEATLRDASDNICNLIRDYQKIDGANRLAEVEDAPETKRK